MNTDPSTPGNDANLSALGRELLATGGSKPSGPWVPPTAEELGKLLPEYDIVKMLGRGGMGAVYMGRQISLDRPVAIKILSNTLDEADASFAERFKNEARAMGKLNHPGIVAVHDFGQTSGGLLYIVMEYVEGTDVARMIAKSGRLHTEHAMAITAHVCDALAYAHDRGIIHRDIKPANIMVGYDGVVKVADFGLAKMTQSGVSGLTQSGMAMGTLHYMAPEALMLGSGVDHRADIYAVGVMLYQMLTGKIPQGMFELPSLQVSGLDPRYDGIIAKALREDREKRYQSVGEMRGDLDGILTQPVVKVEESAEAAPAALPTQARPQRPGGQPYRPPQSVAHRPQPAAKSSSAGLVWLVVAVGLGTGAYMIFGGGRQSVPPAATQAVTVSEPERAPSPRAASGATLPAAGTTAPTPAVVLSDVWTELTDGKTFNGWEKWGTAEWSADDGALSAANGGNGLLHRQLPSPWFELTGEMLVSAQGNGGIMFHFTNPEKLGVGFELQLAGSLAKRDPIGTGGLFTFGKGGADINAPAGLLPDNTFGKFRLLVLPGRIQAWIGDRQTVDYKGDLSPGANSMLAICRWGPDGKAAYRNLRVKTDVTAGEMPVAAMTPQAPAPATFDLKSLPDFRTRVANYQKARQAQLSDLSGKYRNALTAARAEALKSGVLADVTALDEAIARATTLADEIETNLSSLEVKPLSALPQLSATVPQRLKDLRVIFERETAKIETTLVASLDQSLATVQASLTQAANLPAAKAVEDYRKHMMAAFKTTNTVPVAAAPAQPSSAASPLLQATKDKPFVNSLGMKHVPVPGTNILMCIHETRKGDYAAYAAASSGVNGEWRTAAYKGIEVSPTDNHPVVSVSWEDCRQFCQWLSGKEGRNYRLPSDREWSYAIGIADQEDFNVPVEARVNRLPQIWPWGTSFPPPPNFGNFADESLHSAITGPQYILGYQDGFVTTAPVMSFAPNSLGIHDLAGNVYELCEDPYYATGDQKAARGGFFLSVMPGWMLSSHRTPKPKDVRINGWGFRVVVDVPASSSSASHPSPAVPRDIPTSNPTTTSLATKDKPFVNSLGMKFVPVPGTKVLMCIHETRRRDFVAFAADKRGAGQSWQSAAYQALPVGAEDDHPVVMVSWEECANFCDWLTQKSRIKHRLPTDREWSLAVGIGDREDASKTPEELKNMISGVWPYGMQYPPVTKVGNYADQAFGAQFPGERILNSYADGFAGTAPVMSFPPNVLGIYDLGGNVWEWCQDLYGGTHPSIVTRGAAFDDAAELWMRSSHRAPRKKEQAHPTVGFRIVIELP